MRRAINVNFADVEEWTAEHFPGPLREYRLLQFRMRGKSAKEKANYQSLKNDFESARSEFISCYKIFKLRQFDQAEYEHKLETLVSAKQFGDFPSRFLHIGFLPPVYQDIGYPSAPLFVSSRHLYLIANETGFIKGHNAHYHKVPMDTLKALPGLIQDPLLILDLHNKNCSTLALLNVGDAKNNPVALYSIPAGDIVATTKNVAFNAPVTLSLYGLDERKLQSVYQNMKSGALYVKKEAMSVSPIPYTLRRDALRDF